MGEQPSAQALPGIAVERTAITEVEPIRGQLNIRGYSIHELATQSSAEETAWLLVNGRLPVADQLDSQRRALAAGHVPHPALTRLLPALADAAPIDALAAALALDRVLAAEDRTAEGLRAAGTRLTALVPAILAAHHRIRLDLPETAPGPGQSIAEALAEAFAGGPDPALARLLDRFLLLNADHGLTPSAFALRVAVGAGADLHGGLLAALPALGTEASEALPNVMALAARIGAPERAAALLEESRRSSEPLPGLAQPGHPGDPRARHLAAGIVALAEARGRPGWLTPLLALAEAAAAEPRRGLHPTAGFWAAILLRLAGLPRDLGPGLMAAARIPGLVAHAVEQLRSGLPVRPEALYCGPSPRSYRPLAERR